MRNIPTWLVPQADKVLTILDVLEAIEFEKYSDEAIASHCKLPSRRQGGYYKVAAQSIGLIRWEAGRLIPTVLGNVVANVEDHNEKIALLRCIVLVNPAVRLLYDGIEDSSPVGLDRSDLLNLLKMRTNLSLETARRRVQTILRWLTYLKMVETKGSRVVTSENLRTA